MSNFGSQPHRRRNPLTGEWVLVSPHRAERPWLGEHVPPPQPSPPAYDPACYLCPGNQRARGIRNPAYDAPFVFDNDYPALLADTAERSYDGDGLLVAQSERGTCRVVCFSPRHDLHLGAMPPAQIAAIIDCWAGQYVQLGALPFVNAVTVFENRGPMMGASNPHPHGQIWAESSIPNELAKETERLRNYRDARGACLLCTYVARELATGERVVFANDLIAAIVPFWAVWPFEILLLPVDHCGSLDRLDGAQRAALAQAIAGVVGRYDRLFGVPFPYSMGFHQRPCDGDAHEEWHVHGHYYPPLLRSADLRKYMVGYEMLAQPQRDFTAEQAAQRLRDA